MLVVWKLNIELPRALGIAKRESRLIARRNLCMAVGTNSGLGAFEELLAMAPHAGIVIRIVGNVGKASGLLPIGCGNFVAGLAGFLMLFGRVRKLLIIDLSAGGPALVS